MQISVWFWIIMAFWLVLSLWREYVPGSPYPIWRGVGSLLLFVLFLLLGWKVFGSPVQ